MVISKWFVEINLIFYSLSSMLQFSQFVWPLSYLVWDVFNNFLLIDATDRSKISRDQKRFFIAVSLNPFNFSRTLPLKQTTFCKLIPATVKVVFDILIFLWHSVVNLLYHSFTIFYCNLLYCTAFLFIIKPITARDKTIIWSQSWSDFKIHFLNINIKTIFQ